MWDDRYRLALGKALVSLAMKDYDACHEALLQICEYENERDFASGLTTCSASSADYRIPYSTSCS